MHNVTPFCFTDKNKTVSRFESRFNLLKYRTLHKQHNNKQKCFTQYKFNVSRHYIL